MKYFASLQSDRFFYIFQNKMNSVWVTMLGADGVVWLTMHGAVWRCVVNIAWCSMVKPVWCCMVLYGAV